MGFYSFGYPTTIKESQELPIDSEWHLRLPISPPDRLTWSNLTTLKNAPMLKHQAVKPKKQKCTIKHQNKDKYFYFT
jgi:hypothetical protein